jgi:hypothetical protein
MSGAKRKLTQSLFGVVGLLGVASVLILVSDQPAHYSLQDLSQAQTPLSLARKPAATTMPSATSEVSGVDRHILELTCDLGPRKWETSARHFRLSSSLCLSQELAKQAQQVQRPQEIRVVNKSNGYVATVFFQHPDRFMTDFINLSEGSNEISIITKSAGSTPQERTIQVSRSRRLK